MQAGWSECAYVAVVRTISTLPLQSSSIPERHLSVSGTIDAAKKRARTSFTKDKRPARTRAFKKTSHIVPDGPACRIYGSMEAKKVTGNLHITTLGHGYFSWEHTEHKLMNLSHVIHEFSFGPYFPEIAQPLDSSVEVSSERRWQGVTWWPGCRTDAPSRLQTLPSFSTLSPLFPQHSSTDGVASCTRISTVSTTTHAPSSMAKASRASFSSTTLSR